MESETNDLLTSICKMELDVVDSEILTKPDGYFGLLFDFK